MNLGLLGDHLAELGGWPDLGTAPYPGPVLWLAGARSAYVQPEFVPAMRALFPRVQLVRVKDAGHWVHSDQPGVFVAALTPVPASSDPHDGEGRAVTVELVIWFWSLPLDVTAKPRARPGVPGPGAGVRGLSGRRVLRHRHLDAGDVPAQPQAEARRTAAGHQERLRRIGGQTFFAEMISDGLLGLPVPSGLEPS